MGDNTEDSMFRNISDNTEDSMFHNISDNMIHNTNDNMSDNMTVQTNRLIIRLLSDEEMEAIIQRENVEELRSAYFEMLSGSKNHPDLREWYALWDIRLVMNPDIAIGDLSFKGLSAEGMVEIGYGIYPAYEGHGYATEAVLAMAQWAVSQEGVKLVEAEVDPDNAASHRVLEKAGFVPKNELGKEGPRFIWIHS